MPSAGQTSGWKGTTFLWYKMFFKFRNTLYATRQRFPKEQKGFACFWSLQRFTHVQYTHTDSVPNFDLRFVCSSYRVKSVREVRSIRQASIWLRTGHPEREQKLDIEECAVAERKRRYTNIFHVLKVCHSGNATNASAYAWTGDRLFWS